MKTKKNILFNKPILLICVLFLVLTNNLLAQNVFNQRTSSKATGIHKDKTIYNLRGDFEMIGNSNLRSSTNAANNSNNQMVYVNVDNTRVNSSSAYLNIQQDDCRKIVYAGLYWGGRAQNTELYNNNYTMDVEKNIVENVINEDIIFIHEHSLNFNLSINRYDCYWVNPSDCKVEYVISKDGVHIATFRYNNSINNNDAVSYRLGNNTSYIDINGSNSTVANNTKEFVPSQNISFTIEGTTFKLKKVRRYSRDDGSQNEYRNPQRNNITFEVSGNYVTDETSEVVLDKRKVKIKNENATGYTEVEIASTNDINFPNTNTGSSYIYAAYADVTDYVKANGGGMYTVADMYLREGNGGNTGFGGGWGMVVIYEDPDLPWRDITIFDGYAYVESGTTSPRNIHINGFRSAQGDVPINVDMGFMAIEGEDGITGDYFRMRNSSHNGTVPNSFSSTNNTHNTNFPFITTTGTTRQSDDFFNSSIDNGYGTTINVENTTVASRIPYNTNNYGFDLAKIRLDNADKKFIKNNQSSTDLYYGTSSDTYMIFNVVFAVDAFVPNAQNENTPVSIYNPVTNETFTYGSELQNRLLNLQPHDEVTFTAELKNYGGADNERVVGPLVNNVRDNVTLNINIPRAMTLLNASLDIETESNNILAVDAITNYNNHFGTIFWQSSTTPTQTINGVLQPVIINGENEERFVLPSTNETNSIEPGGSLVWRPVNIPRQNESASSHNAMATLTYTLKVIDDCILFLSSEDNCITDVSISGENIGFGEQSNSPMGDKLVVGYTNPICGVVQPIYGVNVLNVSPSNEYLNACRSSLVSEELRYEHFCDYSNDSDIIIINNQKYYSIAKWNTIKNLYPEGTNFYRVKPNVTGYLSSLVTTSSNGVLLEFLPVQGSDTILEEEWFYAVLPGVTNVNCFFNIHIVLTKISSHPEVDATNNVCTNIPFTWPVSLSTIGQSNGFKIQIATQNNEASIIYDSNNLNNTTPVLTQSGIHQFWTREVAYNSSNTIICVGPWVQFSLSADNCKIPINPMIQTPLNRTQ